MKALDISNMKRDPKFMSKYVKKIGDSLIAQEDVFYLFPDKYIDKKLSVIDVTCSLLACMSICKDDKYAVMKFPCKVQVTPTSIEDVVIDNVLYKKINIEAGTPILDTTAYVKDGSMVYDVFEYFIIQGKVPWFLDYEDLFEFFKNVPEYTGTTVGRDPLVFEILVAIISRDETKLDRAYRNIIRNKEDLKNKGIKYIGLLNIYYSFRSTLAKISGSYFREGIISAIVNGPTKEATDLERIVRD